MAFSNVLRSLAVLLVGLALKNVHAATSTLASSSDTDDTVYPASCPPSPNLGTECKVICRHGSPIVNLADCQKLNDLIEAVDIDITTSPNASVSLDYGACAYSFRNYGTVSYSIASAEIIQFATNVTNICPTYGGVLEYVGVYPGATPDWYIVVGGTTDA